MKNFRLIELHYISWKIVEIRNRLKNFENFFPAIDWQNLQLFSPWLTDEFHYVNLQSNGEFCGNGLTIWVFFSHNCWLNLMIFSCSWYMKLGLSPHPTTDWKKLKIFLSPWLTVKFLIFFATLDRHISRFFSLPHNQNFYWKMDLEPARHTSNI